MFKNQHGDLNEYVGGCGKFISTLDGYFHIKKGTHNNSHRNTEVGEMPAVVLNINQLFG